MYYKSPARRHRLRALLACVTFVGALLASALQAIPVGATATLTYSGSAVSGAVESYIPLPGLSVGGDDASIPITLSIDDGLLSMTTTSGLVFQTAPVGSTISFRGSVVSVNAALATLRYRSITPGAKTLHAISIGTNDVYNPDNGHFYELVDHHGNITWAEARDTAMERTKNGATGYLATITSAEENSFIATHLSGDGWIGANDSLIEGDWQWASGPEASQSFWSGAADGAVTEGGYANWATGEPNDSDENEDCAEFFYNDAHWNDVACSGSYMDHYIVEYGAPGDLPTAPPAATIDITITAPTPSTVSVANCAELAGIYQTGSTHRYDNISLTADIDCTGVSFLPLFDQVDSDFDVLGYRGEFDGNGFTISNLVIDRQDYNNVGLFASINTATIHDLTISGSANGYVCVGGLAGMSRNSSVTNVQTSVDLLGWQDTGGLIGCLVNDIEGTYAIQNVNSDGIVTGMFDTVGGLIGEATYSAGTTTLSNNQFNGSLEASHWAAGAIIGELRVRQTAAVSISNSSAVVGDESAARSVGGVAGYALVDNSGTLTIDSITTIGSIIAAETAGGLIGEAYNYAASPASFTIQNSHLSTGVTTVSYSRAGGIVGYAERLNLSRVSTSGSINSQNDEAGGIVGTMYDGAITQAAATGAVNANNNYAGGIAGNFAFGTINQSYATGSVTATNSAAGGLVGYLEGNLEKSYARGAADTLSGAGGLVGMCVNGSVDTAHATGAVTGSSELGGLIGYAENCSSENSFWDTETSLQATSAGTETGKTTAELTNRDTILNLATPGLSTAWDVRNDWEVNETFNNGYPCLLWQSSNCHIPDYIDEDSDGIPSIVEILAPNNGDGNNDGVKDRDQENVSSLVNDVSTTYSVVAVDAACTFTAVDITPEATQPNQGDGGFDYNSGLLSFTAGCGTPGYATNVTVITYGIAATDLILRKYNPITDTYFTIDNALLNEVTINGQTAVEATYTVTDGGSLDTDGLANGTIVDPVGFASVATPTQPGDNGNHGEGNNGGNGNHGEGNNGNHGEGNNGSNGNHGEGNNGNQGEGNNGNGRGNNSHGEGSDKNPGQKDKKKNSDDITPQNSPPKPTNNASNKEAKTPKKDKNDRH